MGSVFPSSVMLFGMKSAHAVFCFAVVVFVCLCCCCGCLVGEGCFDGGFWGDRGRAGVDLV